jgi:hypothetical protein
MVAEDLRLCVETEPTKPSRQCPELFPRVMPLKRQYAHLPQLRVRTRSKDFPFRTFYVHLDEVEALHAR